MNEKPRLREIRKSQGLTVAELARRTGLHPTTLFDLEAGRRYAYPGYRSLLSETLGVEADLLFGPLESEGSSKASTPDSNPPSGSKEVRNAS